MQRKPRKKRKGKHSSEKRQGKRGKKPGTGAKDRGTWKKQKVARTISRPKKKKKNIAVSGRCGTGTKKGGADCDRKVPERGSCAGRRTREEKHAHERRPGNFHSGDMEKPARCTGSPPETRKPPKKKKKQREGARIDKSREGGSTGREWIKAIGRKKEHVMKKRRRKKTRAHGSRRTPRHKSEFRLISRLESEIETAIEKITIRKDGGDMDTQKYS